MTIRRYPLAAANGRAIPAEVFGAAGQLTQAITTSALGTLIRDINYKQHLIHILCTQDAVITFSADATLGAEDTEAFWMKANEFYILEPMQEYYDITADTSAGTAYINTVLKYDTLGTEVQTDFG